MPAGSTYTPIATTTLGSAATSYTFSSISGSYTDLVLVISLQTANPNAGVWAQFNSDTGSNYSQTELFGNGSSAGSMRGTSGTNVRIGNFNTNASSTFSPIIVNLQNYSNTTTYKTILTRSGSAANGVDAIAGLWRSTSAINSIKIGEDGGGNLNAGSTFTLYGIASA